LTLQPASRWAFLWLLLFAAGWWLARYAEHGAPGSWPPLLALVAQVYTTPGALALLLCCWKAFGAGPNSTAHFLFVALASASLWTLTIYLVTRLIRWLRRAA
jgi:hypothetical protein